MEGEEEEDHQTLEKMFNRHARASPLKRPHNTTPKKGHTAHTHTPSTHTLSQRRRRSHRRRGTYSTESLTPTVCSPRFATLTLPL